MRTALIFGISGQDGAYLARHLIDRGYDVHGTSRNTAQSFSRLRAVGVADDVEIHPIAPTNPEQVLDGIVKVAPDEIYYLAGQSSVGLSFEIPTETFGGIAVGVINVLEAVRRLRAPVKFFNAATSEM